MLLEVETCKKRSQALFNQKLVVDFKFLLEVLNFIPFCLCLIFILTLMKTMSAFQQFDTGISMQTLTRVARWNDVFIISISPSGRDPRETVCKVEVIKNK